MGNNTTRKEPSGPKANTTEAVNSHGLSLEDIQAVKHLLTAHSASPSTSEPSGFYSTLANPGSTLNTHSYAYLLHESDPWLIDSGASKHMTGKSTVFTSYSPQSGRDKVRVADGSLSPILGKWVIVDLYGLHLDDVLHVPNFHIASYQYLPLPTL